MKTITNCKLRKIIKAEFATKEDYKDIDENFTKEYLDGYDDCARTIYTKLFLNKDGSEKK